MANSIYGNLLLQVVNSLSSIQNVPLNAAGQPNVSARTKPLVLPIDVLPLILVWPGAGSEKVKELRFGAATGMSTGVIWTYPVNVVLLEAGNRDVQSNLQVYLSLRQAIRNQLFVAITGFSNVFDDSVEPGDVFELQAFLAGNYDIGSWQMYYETSEAMID